MSIATVEENRNAVRFGSLALGNFAAIWGFVVAPFYLIAFGVLLPQVRSAGPAAIVLPLEIPLAGLVMAAISLALSDGSDADGRIAGRVGLGLNLVPLVAAAVLWWLRTTAA